MTGLRLLLLLALPLTGLAVLSPKLAGSAAAICHEDESVILRSAASPAPQIKVDYDYDSAAYRTDVATVGYGYDSHSLPANSATGQAWNHDLRYDYVRGPPHADFAGLVAPGSGGFGVAGYITEGAYPLDAATQAALRSEILAVAKSKSFLKSAGLYGKSNRAARREFWNLLRRAEVTGSTKGGAAGLLSFGKNMPHELRIAIKPAGRPLGVVPRRIPVKHELMHFVREARAVSAGKPSLFELERSLKWYDPRLYALGVREEVAAWWLTFK
jgi:hypothetical protein